MPARTAFSTSPHGCASGRASPRPRPTSAPSCCRAPGGPTRALPSARSPGLRSNPCRRPCPGRDPPRRAQNRRGRARRRLRQRQPAAPVHYRGRRARLPSPPVNARARDFSRAAQERDWRRMPGAYLLVRSGRVLRATGGGWSSLRSVLCPVCARALVVLARMRRINPARAAGRWASCCRPMTGPTAAARAVVRRQQAPGRRGKSFPSTVADRTWPDSVVPAAGVPQGRTGQGGGLGPGPRRNRGRPAHPAHRWRARAPGRRHRALRRLRGPCHGGAGLHVRACDRHRPWAGVAAPAAAGRKPCAVACGLGRTGGARSGCPGGSDESPFRGRRAGSSGLPGRAARAGRPGARWPQAACGTVAGASGTGRSTRM